MNKNNFLFELKKYRKIKDMTQRELSKKICVSPQVISNWERGYTKGIDLEILCKLSKVLNCSVDNLLGLSNECVIEHWSKDELKEIKNFKNYLKIKRGFDDVY
ncbi:MAG: helix-turn-helix transcriptional regulator [Peptostreptococcaceae bacterium]|nr:helix-turn-helix transcriptional regulator [Peptostreptococcaceae bacterium]